MSMDPQRLRGTLFVSTVSSPSKAVVLGLSPNSTTMGKQTETPRKLKSKLNDNNSEDENTNPRFKQSDSWKSRAGFSPRPHRSNNPARRPVQSASSIRALRIAEENEDGEVESSEGVIKCGAANGIMNDKTEEPGPSNQSQLERIQEANDSEDETENDSQDEDDECNDSGDEDDTLQLYKSFSGDLVIRYDGLARNGCSSLRGYEDEDDMVQM